MPRSTIGPLSLLLLVPTALAAEQQPAPAGSTNAPSASLVQELKWLQAESITVTTASLREESVSHAPATVRVVTRRQISERGYRNLEDLLTDLPGVDVLDHVQNESRNRIGIRGVSGNNKFLILQDGVRIGSPTGEPILPISDNFPLFYARQVEVLYGPASALYGADAFSGVINIITEEPTKEGNLEARAEGGEFDSYRLEFFGGKRFSDQFALTLGGHYMQTRGPNLADAYPAQFNLGDLVTADGRTVVRAADRAGFEAPVSAFSTFAKLQIGESLTIGWNQSIYENRTSEGSLPSREDYAAGAESQALLLTPYLKYQHALTDRITGQFEVNYSRYEQLPESRFHNRISGFQDAYKYGLGERFQVEPRVAIDFDRHVVTAGGTFEYYHSIPHVPDLLSKYDTSKDPDEQLQPYPGTNGNLTTQIFDLNYYNLGAFLQEQSQWNEKFSTTVGLRYDYNEDYGSSVNPRVGLVFQPSEKTTWKAHYGHAFLAPAPFLRYEHFGSFAFQRPDGIYQSFFFRIPNPELDPEQMQTVELSVSRNLTEAFKITAVGYYSQVEDLILPSPTSTPVTNFIPGGFIASTDHEANIGELNAYGAELIAEYERKWGNTRADLWASYSRTDGELENTETRQKFELPFTSQDKVKAGLTFNYNDRLVFTPSVQWIGEQAGFVASSTDPFYGQDTPSYFLVNLYAEVRNKTHNLAVYLRVNNLFDERYFNAGRGGNNFFESPQNPRWIMAGVRLSY